MCVSWQQAAGKLESLHAVGQAWREETTMASNVIDLLTVNPTTAYHIKGIVNLYIVNFMIDTGAAVSLLNFKIWDKVKMASDELLQWPSPGLVGVGGMPIEVRGTTKLNVGFEGKQFVIDVVIADLGETEAIVGLDFLEGYQSVINTKHHTLDIEGHHLSIPLYKKGVGINPDNSISVVLPENLQIPGCSQVEVCGKLTSRTNQVLLVEGRNISQQPLVLIATSVVKACGSKADAKIPVRVLNLSPDTVTIYKGTKVAEASPLEENDTALISEVHHPGNTKNPPDVPMEKRQLLWQAVESTANDLSEEQRKQLFAVLLEFSDVFATDSADLGHTVQLEHHIDTGDATPTRQPARRTPFVHQKEVQKLLKDMQSNKIIQPSKSPWASPVVLVKKKDGTLRFCIDYRKLNAATRRDAYPLPRIDDSLQALSGSQWFSTIDLLSGYWQVGIAEKDKEKTAFITQKGLFEFNVMPFGLCNAPATFQRLMDLTLAGMLWTECLVYLDDVIIFGRTFEEHLRNLGSVLERLRGVNLKAKPSKCAFFQKQVLYLGHIVSSEGVSTDPSKTEKVAAWPTPGNVQELSKFLGLASYYRRFINKFAEIAKPLHRLTERGRQFKWTTECDTAFVKLKLQLCSSPTLTFPDFSLPFILDTDASQFGIGAILSQEQHGEEKVIAYASRTLSKAERRYSVTRKELLAVVTYIHYFRQFLLGRQFTLRTDHGSLQWIQTLKEPEGQLARWLERLQEYNFEIKHRKGCQHQNADALSRYPFEIEISEQPEFSHHENKHTNLALPVVSSVDTYVLMERTPEELRNLQLTDSEIGPILQAIENNSRPSIDDIQGKSRSYRLLLQQWDQLYIQDGLLFRRYEDASGHTKWTQLVVPQKAREEVLSALHSGIVGGHLGEAKRTILLAWTY